MNRSLISVSAMVTLTLILGGCERKKESTTTNTSSNTKSTDQHEGHDHGPNDGHVDEDGKVEKHGDHSHDDHGHGHGKEELVVGTREIGEYTVKVMQFGYATNEAPELAFEINVDGARSPNAVRVLVRNTAGEESLRVKANKVGEHAYDAHVTELPPGLKNGGVVVVEIESSGVPRVIEFDIKKN